MNGEGFAFFRWHGTVSPFCQCHGKVDSFCRRWWAYIQEWKKSK